MIIDSKMTNHTVKVLADLEWDKIQKKALKKSIKDDLDTKALIYQQMVKYTMNDHATKIAMQSVQRFFNSCLKKHISQYMT